MKVCGKGDILVPECSDCSELEERVDAVEECCDDAHDEIDTLTTDKADKTYVDDSIDNVNQTIADVADTLGERIDNVITASDPSVTTLWEGVLEQVGDTVQLSQDVNDFDYLDIYYRTSVDESEGYYNNVRIPADQFANYIITVGGTLSPLGESPNLTQYLTQVSFVDDTATIDNIREWSWNGSQSSDASDDMQAETGVTIYRIDGVKEAGGNAEIADAREGVDGTIYPSLGDAIRGQIQDTRDMIPDQYVRDVEVNGESVVDANSVAHIEIPEMTDTVTGNPIVVEDAQGKVKSLKVDIEPEQDGTPWQDATLETAPYLYRATPDRSHSYNSEYDKLVGGTVAWNQLLQIPSSSATKTLNGITMTDNRDGSYTLNGSATAVTYFAIAINMQNTLTSGHKILIYGATSAWVSFVDGWSNRFNCSYKDKIFDYVNSSNSRVDPSFYVPEGATLNNVNLKPQIIDLTQMFGSTIADYIYSLETATAGAGVAWFKKYFPKPYYAYNAGQLISVKTSAHNTVGFNQWDEEWEVGNIDDNTGQNIVGTGYWRAKDYIPVISGATYNQFTDGYNGNFRHYFYDANKNWIKTTAPNAQNSNVVFTVPNNACYMRFRYSTNLTNYKNCINLSWDGERDGEYEEYVKHSYPLDSDLELRGIPKLDSANNLYYDGDTYEDDGTVTRRYGIVDISTLEWREYGSTDTATQYYTANLDALAKPQGNIISDVGYYSQPIVANTVYMSQPSGMTYVRTEKDKYESPTAFKTAMSGHYLVYELKEPTTEEADPYQNPQIVDDFGTEEYVDERTVAIPVGHDTRYADIYEIIGKDSITVRQEGKNLFDGTIHAGQEIINVTAGQTYTVSAIRINTSRVAYLIIQRRAIGSSSWIDVAYPISGSTATPQTFTAQDGYEYALYSNTTTWDNVGNVQLELGSVATEYEPYIAPVEHTVNFDDTLYGADIDVTGGDSKNKMARIVLDGTQPIGLVNWQPKTNSIGWIYPYSLTNNKPALTTAVGNIISDTLEAKTYDALFGTDTTGIGVYLNANTYGIVVRVSDTSLTTEAAINAYLAEHPITVVYELASPTDIDTDAQSVTLFKGYNRVSNDGEITMEYCQDIGLVLKELSKLINYPELPTIDGDYQLHVSHAGGEVQYDWS